MAKEEGPLQDSVVDLELDHLGSVSAAISSKLSPPYAVGGTDSPEPAQKLHKESKSATHALGMKLKVFRTRFNPVPFRPIQTLDFDKHEKILKHLGLWDFIHLDFDFEFRPDLLGELIMNFDPEASLSLVDGISIDISRTAIAYALKLPVQEVKIDIPLEGWGLDSYEFIEEFVLNWMLLHEDAWAMPEEVLEWMRFIRERKLDELDWAGLMWFMMKGELMQALELGNCYYASHLQCLMDFQKPALFKQIVTVEGNLEEEQDVEFKNPGFFEKWIVEDGSANEEQEVGCVNMIELDDDDEEDAGVRMIKLDDDGDGGDGDSEDDDDNKDGESDNNADNMVELKDQKIELCLELGNIESNVDRSEDVVELTESKEVQSGCWLFNGRIGSDEHFLQNEIGGIGFHLKRNGEMHVLQGCSQNESREMGFHSERNGEVHVLQRCNQNEIREMGFHSGRKTEVGKENDDISMECCPIEGLGSGNHVGYTGTTNLPSNLPMHIPDHSMEKPIASRADTHVNVGNLLMSRNSLKRHCDYGDGIQNASLSDYHKRMRSDDSWEQKSLEFDLCMEQIQTWMNKARMAYAATEQACTIARTNEQVLLQRLAQQESMIEDLERRKHEDVRKREAEVYRLTRELHFMENLVDGYRSALKKNQRAFSEYRERCPQPEEPLYKDADGGVVLSKAEWEKQEEDRVVRATIEEKITESQLQWSANLEAFLNKINLFGIRLLGLEKEAKNLKEIFTKMKVSKA